MEKLITFLSSAMAGELNEERIAIKTLFNANEKLNSFFELYAIDDHASPSSIQKAYIDKVQESKILICVLGEELRNAVVDEFNIAKENGVNIFCYVKERVTRSVELKEFIEKHAYQVHCGHFYDTSDLTSKIQSDLWGDVFDSYIRGMKSNKELNSQSILTGRASSPNNEYRFYSVDHLIKTSQLEQISSLSNDQLIVFSIVLQEQYGDYRTSLLLLEVALLREPDDWKLHNNRGTVLDAMGLIEAGLYCYKKVLELNPASHTALYNIANSLVTLGREREALRYYESALALSPEKVVALNRIVGIYLRLGYPEKALVFSSRLVAQTDDIIFKTNHALCLSANGLYDKAFATIEQFKENNYYYHYANAQILFKTERYAESIDEIDSILNLGALDYELAIKKFYCLAALGKIDEATQWINIVEKNYPFKADDYNNIGYHLMNEMGLKKQATILFQKAIDQAPQMMVAWNNLQACFGELGDLTACLGSCNDALNIMPFDSKSVKNKYAVLYRMGKIEDAVKFIFQKSFDLVGSNESKDYANLFETFAINMANIQTGLNKFRLDLGLDDGKK